MIGKRFLKSVAKKAVNIGEEISQEAHDAAKFVGKKYGQSGGEIR
jgi:hypothetical protein